MHKSKSSSDLKSPNSTLPKNGKSNPPQGISVKNGIYLFLNKRDDSTFKYIHQVLQKEPLNDSLVTKWLHQISECIPLLDNRMKPLIVDSLKIPWYKGNDIVKERFNHVILALVTMHNFHAYTIVKELFKSLIPEICATMADYESDPFKMCQERRLEYYTICQLIADICNKVPMMLKELIKLSTNLRPYYKCHAYIHVCYVYNLLLLSQMLPEQRREFLQVIIEDMITIDLYLPKEQLVMALEEEDMEEDETLFEMELEDKVISPMETRINSLDALMCLMITYIHKKIHGLKDVSLLFEGKKQKCPVGSSYSSGNYTKGCHCNKVLHDKDTAKDLYENLRHIFDKVILNTKSISHTQFLIFYLLSIRPSLSLDFIDFLKAKVFGPYPLDIRCTAIAYIASLLCRASFVTYEVLHSCMQVLRGWCARYVPSLSKNETEGHGNIIFYYICQTIMYIFTFNYKEYTKTPARLKDAHSLQLDALVKSKLNPITHCTPVIANNFAKISNHFQISYCYALLEEARRKLLPEAISKDTDYIPLELFIQPYFPFDPYYLPRSKEFVKRHYKEFVGMPDDPSEDSDDKEHWISKNSDPISLKLGEDLSGMSLETDGLS